MVCANKFLPISLSVLCVSYIYHYMAKVKHGIAVIIFLTLLGFTGSAQIYEVQYRVDASDSISIKEGLLQTQFASRTEAGTYLAQLVSQLKSKGYITASIDAIELDSLKGTVSLFLGEQYKWARINTMPQDAAILDAVRWPASFDNAVLNFSDLVQWQKKILNYLEETGYPFGKTYLEKILIHQNEVSATLKIEPGPIYKIDSIRVYGDAKVSNDFLQQYLEISNASIYNKKKLQNISSKLSDLNYLQEERPSDLTMLATGSILNLYLKAKRSSQVNALIGFLPNNDATQKKKLLLTVDANILLRNALGGGETIGLIWQQLQQRSPRLNIIYEQPYIFRSSYGLDFSFDMYKLDSIFLNINTKLGVSHKIGTNQSASIFLLRRQTIVSGINTAQIIQTKRLPQEGDVSSFNLGFSYEYNTTDYRFNPRKGNEINVTTSAGTKKIKRNNLILELKDPSNPSFKFESLYDTVKQKAYQIRVHASGAHYVPLGRQSTIKLGANAGIYQSAHYFRNELFQIGGYKLMRGFNEESQYVSQYVIGTVEYRYLIGTNSAFFVFADGGWGKHLLEIKKYHTYMGAGLGLAFETKAGIINLAWAVGKRNDTHFNLRQSKVHLGFVTYF